MKKEWIKCVSLAASFFLLSGCGGKQGFKETPVKPGEDWMGIYVRDQKIGYVYSRQDMKGSNYTFTQKSTMKLEMLGSIETFATTLKASTDSKLDLKDFSFDISSRQNSFFAQGKRIGDKIRINIETSGRKETREIDAKGSLLISPALGHWVLSQSPKPGDKLQVDIFEPTLLRVIPVSVKAISFDTLLIDGKEVPALHLETRMMNLSSEVWLDSSGISIKELQQPGIVMMRESREKALEIESNVEKLDLLSFFAVRPDSLITNPRTIKELVIRIEGLTAADSLSIASSTQKVKYRENGVEFCISSPDTSKVSRTDIPLTEPSEFLSSSVYIQSGDPEIKNKASEIVGDERDVMAASRKLVLWVYKNLRKRATASVPSAVEVLHTLEGDCNEHAILLAALARSEGIPAKINVGLVYLDGAFYYHAWNSLYIGGAWLPVDATFGQIPSDPTHIQLHEGELDEQAKVLSVVGKLKISVISYK